MGIFDYFGMGGLIKTNLKVYFESIKKGVEHEDALMINLKARYPFESGKGRDVSSRWRGARRFEEQLYKAKPPTEINRDKDELKDLIYAMYSIETNLERANYFKKNEEDEKFKDKFNELYDSMKKKYL